MKKLLTKLLALVVVVSFAGLAHGQVNATADVTADVVTALAISNVSDVAFGNVEVGTTPVLEPQGTGHTDVGVTAAAGEFSVDGENGVGVTVDYTDATLSDGSNTLAFTTQLSQSASGDQGASADIASGGSITLDADGYSLYVGGSLPDLTGATTGSYSTSNASGSPVTVTVTYQ